MMSIFFCPYLKVCAVFERKSSTHLFHNLVEEKYSDEQETKHPPVAVCGGRDGQELRSSYIVVRDTGHRSRTSRLYFKENVN